VSAAVFNQDVALGLADAAAAASRASRVSHESFVILSLSKGEGRLKGTASR
jgi:hypothetical protein